MPSTTFRLNNRPTVLDLRMKIGDKDNTPSMDLTLKLKEENNESSRMARRGRPEGETIAARGGRAFRCRTGSLVLGTGVRDRPVMTLANELLERFGSLAGLLSAGREELLAEPGVGEAKVSMLQASIELARRQAHERLRQSDVLSSPEQARRFLHCHLRNDAREVFCCLFLTARIR